MKSHQIKEAVKASTDEYRDKAERVLDGETVIIEGRRGAAFATDRGQLGFQTVLAAIAVVIAAMLAVVVVDRFNSSLGTPSNQNLSDAQTSILTGFADMASLIGPLLLVGIAVVIIALIRRAN